jgi:hypothetical protein
MDGFHALLTHCTSCHGDYRAAPRPGCEHVERPFFHNMHVTEARVRNVVRHGIHSNAVATCRERMPAFSSARLSDQTLDLMIAQLRVAGAIGADAGATP